MNLDTAYLDFKNQKQRLNSYFCLKEIHILSLHNKWNFSHPEINSYKYLFAKLNYESHLILYTSQTVLHEIQNKIQDQLS